MRDMMVSAVIAAGGSAAAWASVAWWAGRRRTSPLLSWRLRTTAEVLAGGCVVAFVAWVLIVGPSPTASSAWLLTFAAAALAGLAAAVAARVESTGAARRNRQLGIVSGRRPVPWLVVVAAWFLLGLPLAIFLSLQWVLLRQEAIGSSAAADEAVAVMLGWIVALIGAAAVHALAQQDRQRLHDHAVAVAAAEVTGRVAPAAPTTRVLQFRSRLRTAWRAEREAPDEQLSLRSRRLLAAGLVVLVLAGAGLFVLEMVGPFTVLAQSAGPQAPVMRVTGIGLVLDLVVIALLWWGPSAVKGARTGWTLLTDTAS